MVNQLSIQRVRQPAHPNKRWLCQVRVENVDTAVRHQDPHPVGRSPYRRAQPQRDRKSALGYHGAATSCTPGRTSQTPGGPALGRCRGTPPRTRCWCTRRTRQGSWFPGSRNTRNIDGAWLLRLADHLGRQLIGVEHIARDDHEFPRRSASPIHRVPQRHRAEPRNSGAAPRPREKCRVIPSCQSAVCRNRMPGSPLSMRCGGCRVAHRQVRGPRSACARTRHGTGET